MKETKRAINKNLVRIVPWVGALLCVTITVGIVVWMISHHKSFKPKEETFRYWMGEQITYDESLTFVHDDKSTTIAYKDEKITSDGTPIVYANRKAMFLPVSMGYLDPDTEEGAKRVNFFATVEQEEDAIYIHQNDRTIPVRGGFLYDGDGTYVLLENSTLNVENMSYELGALTYLKYYYKDSIEVYDSVAEQYYFINITDGNIVVSATNYSINVATGVMTVKDSERILFSDIEAMGVLK